MNMLPCIIAIAIFAQQLIKLRKNYISVPAECTGWHYEQQAFAGQPLFKSTRIATFVYKHDNTIYKKQLPVAFRPRKKTKIFIHKDDSSKLVTPDKYTIFWVGIILAILAGIRLTKDEIEWTIFLQNRQV